MPSERMFLINDYPGIFITGTFELSEQIGNSKLALRVTHENTYKGTLRLDNHGSDLTGGIRGFAKNFTGTTLQE